MKFSLLIDPSIPFGNGLDYVIVPLISNGAGYGWRHVSYLWKGRTNMAGVQKNTRAVDQAEILKSEWIVLVGESLVAVGSIVVVIGLIRAFQMLLNEDTK